ncbi:MAG: adenine phosphoribosyltransferase, partial [Pseudomonadota bacterium]
GCFLINHDFGVGAFLPIIEAARRAHPRLWLGVNFLAVPAAQAYPRLGALQARGLPLDACWADDARLDERSDAQPEADAAEAARAASGWQGLLFAGVAFKKQRPVAEGDWPAAARLGGARLDVTTTSGAATGVEAEDRKVAVFRRALGDRPLALASGVTPDNIARYAEVDAVLVATGINREGDFHNLDPARLAALLRATRKLGGGAVR